nr:glycosyltransferase [Devosia salina]
MGGGPEHLYQLLQHLPAGILPIVACPDEEPYFGRYARLIGPNNVIPVPHRAFKLDAFGYLADEIRKRKVALVHSHGKGAGIYSRLLSARTGVLVVHTFHGLHVGEYGRVKKAGYLAIERALGWFTGAAICVSDGERKLIEAAGFMPQSKLRTVVNGVAIPELRSAEPDQTRLDIVSVSRFDHQKNPELAIEIARQLRQAQPDLKFCLTIVGDGEKRQACIDAVQAAELGEYVSLPGASSNPRSYFRDAHLYLSTSRWEGMPLGVLEAMSEGLPIVATDVVGNRDLVGHNSNGLLFSDGDAVGGAACVANLLDETARHALGAASRAAVESRYSVNVMAQRTAAIYREVLGAG